MTAGAPKLVEVDLATDRILTTVVVPNEALAANSALKDVRIDPARGAGGTAYLTDSAPGHEAFIVVDLATGRARRRLEGLPALRPGPGVVPIVGGQALLQAERGSRRPFAIGLNGISLSADARTLFFSSFTGRRLLSLDAQRLGDPARPDAEVASTVRDLGEFPIAGHFVTDAKDDIYVVGIEHDAVFRRTPDGEFQTLAADARLMWPDTLALSPDGDLYVTASQHDREPRFHTGVDLRRPPFWLFAITAATAIRSDRGDATSPASVGDQRQTSRSRALSTRCTGR